MHDGTKRGILVALVFVFAAGLLFLITLGRGHYSFFDFLRGKALPAEKSRADDSKESRRVPETVTMPTCDPVDLEMIPGLAKSDTEQRFLAAKVMPAVVSINTWRRVRPEVREPERRGGSIPLSKVVLKPGLGSGVIVSREGHVVTNYHVIKDVDQIMVTTDDKKRYEAFFVGADPSVDIAVLAIDSKDSNFPALRFGESRDVERGQIVFAAGSPFGLSGTFVEGNISGEERRVSDTDLGLLQTSAPIGQGNSGGPLVDTRGQIVGINFAIPNMRFWQGIGFAIPANAVRLAFERITREGRPERGWLGVETQPLDPILAVAWGFQHGEHGALITHVVDDSPAERAKLQIGDIVTKVNGEGVRDRDDLIERIQAMEPETKTKLSVFRQTAAEKHIVLDAVIGVSRNDPVTREDRNDGSDSAVGKSNPDDELSDDEIQKLVGIRVAERMMDDADGSTRRVLIVVGVDAHSPAHGILQKADVIRRLWPDPVHAEDDFYQKMVALSKERKRAVLYISRYGDRLFKVVKPALKSK